MYSLSIILALAPFVFASPAPQATPSPTPSPRPCSVKADDCSKIDWSQTPDPLDLSPEYCQGEDFCWRDIATNGTCQVTLGFHTKTVQPVTYSRQYIQDRVGNLLQGGRNGCAGGWVYSEDVTQYRKNYQVYVKATGEDPIDNEG